MKLWEHHVDRETSWQFKILVRMWDEEPHVEFFKNKKTLVLMQV